MVGTEANHAYRSVDVIAVTGAGVLFCAPPNVGAHCGLALWICDAAGDASSLVAASCLCSSPSSKQLHVAAHRSQRLLACFLCTAVAAAGAVERDRVLADALEPVQQAAVARRAADAGPARRVAAGVARELAPVLQRRHGRSGSRRGRRCRRPRSSRAGYLRGQRCVLRPFEPVAPAGRARQQLRGGQQPRARRYTARAARVRLAIRAGGALLALQAGTAQHTSAVQPLWPGPRFCSQTLLPCVIDTVVRWWRSGRQPRDQQPAFPALAGRPVSRADRPRAHLAVVACQSGLLGGHDSKSWARFHAKACRTGMS